MSNYGEVYFMPKQRMKCTFIGKREHIAKVKISNKAYSSQPIDIPIPHGSRNHVIVPDTVRIMFNLDIESTDKTRSSIKNVGGH